jgi:neutral amino acid transport system substrate-binding protein
MQKQSVQGRRGLGQWAGCWKACSMGMMLLGLGFTTAACQEAGPGGSSSGGNSAAPDQLRIGTLLPSTGDLGPLGQGMTRSVPLLVEKVNSCGGVNGKPVALSPVDDQTDPAAGAEGMTKLVEVEKVAGVVGSFASSVSTAAIPIAVKNKVVLISPGSTSPVFTKQAKDFQGYWARTAPPDTYQAQALAKLAYEKGFKTAATVVINNDYGQGFEKEFVQAFKKLGGTITNEAKPTRYDPKATTFETEVQAALKDKPAALAAVLYTETGGLLLKSAYEQGLTKGVQIMLTDGVATPEFAQKTGKGPDGKVIISGAIGTVPGANGTSLADLTQLWKEKTGKELSAYVPHAWDAAALLVLAAEAAKKNSGEAIQSKLREVANAPGKEVSDVCQALELLRKGEDINFQGASSNVDIDENGDVVGSYDVWKIEDDGKLTTTGKVNP